jgi:hypothetical protein
MIPHNIDIDMIWSAARKGLPEIAERRCCDAGFAGGCAASAEKTANAAL